MSYAELDYGPNELSPDEARTYSALKRRMGIVLVSLGIVLAVGTAVVMTLLGAR